MGSNPNIWDEKFIEACLGYALGDALGQRHIGKTRESLKDLQGAVLINPQLQLKYSGDTLVMLAALESFREDKSFDPDAFSDRLKGLYTSNQDTRKFRGSISDLVANLNAGKSLDQSVVNAPDEGISSLAVVLGLTLPGVLRFDQIDPIYQQVTQIFEKINKNPDAVAGALVVAYQIGQCVGIDRMRDDKSVEYLGYVIQFIEKMNTEHKYDKMLEQLKKVKDNYGDPDKVFRELMLEKKDKTSLGPSALETVPAALYCFLSHPNDYQKAVTMALKAGGDVDAIAALTGAMAGVLVKVGALPDWLDRLENEELGRDYIAGKARSLANIIYGKDRLCMERPRGGIQ